MLEQLQNLGLVILIPVAVLAMAVALFVVARLMGRFYVKVAPNEVLVKFGRTYMWADGQKYGYKLITGGAALVIPFLESARTLPLSAFQLKLHVTNVPSHEGVRVTVGAVAIVKVGTEERMLQYAVNRFLDSSLEQIGAFAKEALEGSLRGVVARLTVEELVRDRTKFSAEVQEQVTPDLRRLGLVLDNFLIQDISDEEGYIDALGARRTAEVKRDAAIAEAEARRDEEIRVADANREAKIKSSEAQRAGDVAQARAMEEISNAVRQKEVVEAQNAAQISSERARVEIVASQAAAQEDRKLRVFKVEAVQAETEASINLQEKEKILNERRFEATTIVEAEKKAQANVIQADGQKKATLITADATREADIIKAGGERLAATERAQANYIMAEKQAQADRLRQEQEGLGAKQRQLAESEGLKAMAEAKQRELEAEAAGLRAKKLAEADGEKAARLAVAEGERARLSAEAEGVRLRGLAEAEAVLRKAEAFSQLGPAGQLLEIIDRSPEVIDALGRAGREIVSPLAEAIGNGMANVGEVRIVDLGGGNGNGGGTALDRFIQGVPRSVFATLESAKALGLGPLVEEVAKKLNISPESVIDFLHEKKKEAATEPAAIAKAPPAKPAKDEAGEG
ncbi:MAG: SPFH domain-containing protein [Candidatus Sumerlaeia bacterium]|nr:SPFH domain-containing protein [Candidatus Sumerlaeia bacterium]